MVVTSQEDCKVGSLLILSESGFTGLKDAQDWVSYQRNPKIKRIIVRLRQFCEGCLAADSVVPCEDFTLTLTLSLEGEGIIERPWR